ncbi:helix-turn-helix domain-containing protein [Halalkalicoccus sp. NIPERK01]|uniref:helix-turn-helix domain-containing protein n=1 Tax=Halalkalicoccus sp. NIPERK01 TaxID=3053469 RepID=UPI00256ED0D8|nr:helix-turn-helix domain-containing protein [Halalkalicoccus sp. NIPERK01]MDL5362539.1 helix-turn-helix domain-containing protein [Halalkalicoccus sp. NIPERK01]
MSVFAEFSAPSIKCPFESDLHAHPSVTLEFERVVPLENDTHYLWLVGEHHESVLADLQANPAIETLVLVDELPDRTLVRVTWPVRENPIFQILLDTETTLVSATATADGWVLSVRCLSTEEISRFYTECLDRGLELELHRVNAQATTDLNPYYGLSPKQTEAILEAFQRGYFGVPRGITTDRLADVLGISPQAASERLRRGVRTLIASTLLEEVDESGSDTEE